MEQTAPAPPHCITLCKEGMVEMCCCCSPWMPAPQQHCLVKESPETPRTPDFANLLVSANTHALPVPSHRSQKSLNRAETPLEDHLWHINVHTERENGKNKCGTLLKGLIYDSRGAGEYKAAFRDQLISCFSCL